MSKLKTEYYTNLRKSLQTALKQHQTTIISTQNHTTITSPLPAHSDVVSTTNKAITACYKAGDFQNARHLFDKMPVRNVVSWNAMITGYSKLGMFREALDLISLMHRFSMKLNETTFSTSLSVCGRAKLLSGGKELHGLVLKCGYERFKLVGSSLFYVYGSCSEGEDGKRVFDELVEENELLWSLMLVSYVQGGLFGDALNVFGEIPRRGVVEWTTLISGFAKSEEGCKKAVEMFWAMRKSGEAVPNEFTLNSVVRACGDVGDVGQGRMLHGLIIKLGYEFELLVNSALICFYSNCEVMDDAMRVYKGVGKPSADDSSEIIGGLVKLGRIREAEAVFNRMTEKNPVSYTLMIKAYAKCGQFVDSERLFMQMPVKTLASMNTMIRVYARSGDIDKAVGLFDRTKGEGDPVTWNSMISGYILNNQHENAIKLYLAMCRSSVSQTRVTFATLFHACARLGSFQQGQLLHGTLVKTPFSTNIHVGTALVDMYSKCGSISDANMAFSCISSPNVATWTALINGYAYHGLGSEAVSLFNLMAKGEIKPNAATFVAVLSACARAGLTDEGIKIFESMKENFGITPTIEHFTCVVDLLGRAGLIREAEELIERMPLEADKIMLITLLNACWFWMDTEVGGRVAEKMFALDQYASSACVLMSNIYSTLGKWAEKMKVRDHLRESGGKKDPGFSWIDVNNVFHVFSADDTNHPDFDMIFDILGSLTRIAHSDAQIVLQN